MRYIAQIIMALIWMTGVVISKGFWSTFFCIVFPPWSWYIVVEKALIIQGII